MQIAQLQKTNVPLDIESLDLIGLTMSDVSLGLEDLKTYTANKQFTRVALSFYREGLLGEAQAIDNDLFFYNKDHKSILKIRRTGSFSLKKIMFAKKFYEIDNVTKKLKEIDTLNELLNWTKANNPKHKFLIMAS